MHLCQEIHNPAFVNIKCNPFLKLTTTKRMCTIIPFPKEGLKALLQESGAFSGKERKGLERLGLANIIAPFSFPAPVPIFIGHFILWWES